jgi:hypothetical protein
VSIIAKHSGKALDIPLGLPGNGVPVMQWDPTPGASEQQFLLQDLGDGYCEIVTSKGKVLSVAGGAASAGAALVQELPNRRDHQRFRFDPIPTDPGFVKISVKKSGNMLDITGGFTDNGTAVILFPSHDGANQRFQLRAG